MTISWKMISLLMLRTILNDIGETKYSQEQLERLLITSAYFLPVDVNFNTNYIVDVFNENIAPDPLSVIEDGQDFISLLTLKAACLLDQGQFRERALLNGVTARCGPAVLQTNDYGDLMKDLLAAGPCKMYEDLKQTYNFDYAGRGILRAVMSPFVSNTFIPYHGRN
jgi:hypothetical protein